mgnify:CR=1 FL=1
MERDFLWSQKLTLMIYPIPCFVFSNIDTIKPQPTLSIVGSLPLKRNKLAGEVTPPPEIYITQPQTVVRPLRHVYKPAESQFSIQVHT